MPLASGTIAASGTLGQIIPPSIVLIILADQLANAVDQADALRKQLYKEATGLTSLPSEFTIGSTSAGEMFIGALLPGLVLVALYMVFILALAIVRPKLAPAVRFDGKMDLTFFINCAITLIPPLALIFIVLGSIISGIATVNQAGAVGAVGATLMASYRLQNSGRHVYTPVILAILSLIVISIVVRTFHINIKLIRNDADVLGIALALVATAVFLFAVGWAFWRTYRTNNTLYEVMVETSKATALVFIILLGAAMLTAAFRGFGGEDLVKQFLTNMPGGFWAQFIIVMTVIFVLGFFLDFIEIAVVVVPIVTPILLMDPGANVTAVWVGVMIGLNIQTSFLTPPFGFALFYLRGVAPPSIATLQIYKGVVPFIVLQLIALGVVGYTPSLVNYWPIRLNLLSETAPPPANPRLQYCIEQLVLPQYTTREAEIRGAIAKAKGLDFSYLPDEMRSDMTSSFSKAERVFDLVKSIATAEAAVDAKKPTYAPLHRQVRDIQQDMLRIDEHRKELEQDITRMKRNGRDVTKLEATIATEAEKKKVLAASIPQGWAAEHKAFGALLKTDTDARQRYRRNVDEAYQPLEKLILTIEQAAELERRVGEVKALSEAVANKKAPEAVEQIDAVNKVVGALGGRPIRSELSRARSAMRNRTPDPQKAVGHIQQALKLIEAELLWRKRAASELKPGLDAYNNTIMTTIGLREQPRLPRKEALSVAACMANHRDVSLHF